MSSKRPNPPLTPHRQAHLLARTRACTAKPASALTPTHSTAATRQQKLGFAGGQATYCAVPAVSKMPRRSRAPQAKMRVCTARPVCASTHRCLTAVTLKLRQVFALAVAIYGAALPVKLLPRQHQPRECCLHHHRLHRKVLPVGTDRKAPAWMTPRTPANTLHSLPGCVLEAFQCGAALAPATQSSLSLDRRPSPRCSSCQTLETELPLATPGSVRRRSDLF